MCMCVCVCACVCVCVCVCVCLSLLIPMTCVCLHVGVISNQSNSKIHVIVRLKSSVNLTPSCIKHSKVLLVLHYHSSTSSCP